MQEYSGAIGCWASDWALYWNKRQNKLEEDKMWQYFKSTLSKAIMKCTEAN